MAINGIRLVKSGAAVRLVVFACFQREICYLTVSLIVGKNKLYYLCHIQPYAKAVKAERNKKSLELPRRILSYAKAVQTGGKKACSQYPECGAVLCKDRDFADNRYL